MRESRQHSVASVPRNDGSRESESRKTGPRERYVSGVGRGVRSLTVNLRLSTTFDDIFPAASHNLSIPLRRSPIRDSMSLFRLRLRLVSPRRTGRDDLGHLSPCRMLSSGSRNPLACQGNRLVGSSGIYLIRKASRGCQENAVNLRKNPPKWNRSSMIVETDFHFAPRSGRSRVEVVEGPTVPPCAGGY
jgi:hypothetical protein